MSNEQPIQPPAFEADDLNVVHLGSNTYAMKFPRNVRVVVREVNRLKTEFGIVPAVEFMKEGLRGIRTERIGSSKALKKYPAIPKALVLKGLDPNDYILIRFGPKTL